MSTESFDYIVAALNRCVRENNGGLFFTELPNGDVEQTNHGTTDYALAAYAQLRYAWSYRIAAAAGVPDYMVPDGHGKRTVAEPALMLVRYDGRKMFLTGCSWGYGGEGPHGTAAILHDLEFFPTLGDAMRFVSGQPSMQSTWELKR